MKETVMEMLLRQCREIGIGTVIIDQQPSLISTTALANTYTSICLNQKSPSDISKTAYLSLVDNDEKKYFSMLPVGWGIVKLQDRWTRPFLVRFPLINVRKGFVTDDVLKNSLGNSGDVGNVLRDSGNSLDVVGNSGLLDEVDLAFLKDVAIYCDDGVYVRYERLNLNPAIGHKIKDGLIAMGLIEQQMVDLGKTRKALLRLTKKGGKVFEELQTGGNESIVHSYWKRFYAERFKIAGYEVKEEVARDSGRVDVLAVKSEDRIAIEVETGKSDVVKNVKQDLMFGCTRIVIVATDKWAFGKVERDLAKADLLGLDKIRIVLQDGPFVENELDVEIGG